MGDMAEFCYDVEKNKEQIKFNNGGVMVYETIAQSLFYKHFLRKNVKIKVKAGCLTEVLDKEPYYLRIMGSDTWVYFYVVRNSQQMIKVPEGSKVKDFYKEGDVVIKLQRTSEPGKVYDLACIYLN